MKKTQEIIGLPVFSIVDGRKIGQVKDLIINPEEGKVDYIMVSNGSWYVGARVLSYRSVAGIGEHAVTTESETLLTHISETANANNLLERNIEIKGSRVLTNRGNLIGVISEYEIEESSGRITRLEYKTIEDENKIEVINSDQVLTYGGDVIVVRQDADNTTEKPQETAATSEDEISRNTNGSSDGTALFKQRQREFIMGKKVTQDIKDDDGQVIIAEGTVINQDIIQLAEAKDKFLELSHCAK
ncbi:MAG: PRC-barrel domain-containing protein [Syntrophomonadaceae bacterium]|jgi:uncharacterized protein YrrD